MITEKAKILIAEDDADDRLLIQESFSQSNSNAELVFFENGELLLDHLKRNSGSELNNSKPFFILLDLNMPKKNGLEVLEEVRANPKLNWIPIIVFSTSSQEKHIFETYKLGCNSFITKPTSLEGYYDVSKNLEAYWLRTAQLPKVQLQ